MATWLDKQRDKAKRDKLAREMTHQTYQKINNPVGDAAQRYLEWLKPRLSSPLATLASEVKKYQAMPADELAMEFGPSGGALSGLAGIFAGKGAKTADLAKLALAESMAAKGIPDAQIWKETGWTLNTPDKIPRFEIPDNTAKQLKNAKKTGMIDLEDWIAHPELQAAYPRMFDREFAGMRGEGGILAMAEPGHRGGEFGWNMLKVAGDTKGDARKSVTLHELQHAIQQREGFARGGNLEDVKGIVLPQQQRMLDELASIGEPLDKNGMPLAFKPANQLTPDEKALKDRYTYLVQQTQLNAGDNYQAYKQLAGEAEARLTQSRMAMTPEERLAQYPYDPDYFQQATGVPLRDLIVRMK